MPPLVRLQPRKPRKPRRHVANVEVGGSTTVSPSHALLAQLAEAQILRTWRSGFESPGRYSWKVNRPGRRAPLLADARVTAKRGTSFWCHPTAGRRPVKAAIGVRIS